MTKWHIISKDLKTTVEADTACQAIIQALDGVPIENLGLIILASPLDFDEFPLDCEEQADVATGWATPEALLKAGRINEHEYAKLMMVALEQIESDI